MIDIPRKKHCAHRGDASDKNHCKADAIDREMIIHPERRYPRHTHDGCEVRKIDNWRLKESGETYSEACDGGAERDPARKNARQKQQNDRSGKRDVNRPGDHALRIGEHTRLACCFRRPAGKPFVERVAKPRTACRRESSRWRGRHRQHARRVRSPARPLFKMLDSIATPCSVKA